MMIKSANLTYARLMDFYQVMLLITSYLDKEDVAALQLAEVTAELKKVLDSLSAAIKQAQKTGYTNSIIAADDGRDNIFTGFTGALRSLTRFPDEEIAENATKLLLITDKYGLRVTRLPQREESAILTSIVSELQSAENTALLESTGLNMWVEKLAQANTEFDELYSHRTDKEADFVTGLTRTERNNTQAAFEKLVQAIEAYAFINGEAAYKHLAEEINTEVANVKQAAKARTTMNENSDKVTVEA